MIAIAILKIAPNYIRDEIKDRTNLIINNSNVTYGIDEEAIKAALRVSSTDFLFAKGTKAIPGENAYIVQHVEIKDHGKPAELEHGKVDYKNLNLYLLKNLYILYILS